MTDAPAPLVPSDVDLRDFAFMPLDVLRLRDSDLASAPDAEVFRCSVISWCVAWHQLPAASLPDDDVALARLLGFGRDMKGWRRVRAGGGLRGWVKCDDGRLYHPVVAEKARDAWAAKLAQRARTEAARRAREEARHRQSQSVSQTTETSVTETVTESKGQGQGQRQGDSKTPPAPVGGEGRFPEFWSAWPSSARKQDRKKCLAKWQRCRWDAEADAILAHVAAMKGTKQWLDGYDPAPLTYLNGERWRDGVPVVAAAASSADGLFEGVH